MKTLIENTMKTLTSYEEQTQQFLNKTEKR